VKRARLSSIDTGKQPIVAAEATELRSAVTRSAMVTRESPLRGRTREFIRDSLALALDPARAGAYSV
jgi:hypothetical protein